MKGLQILLALALFSSCTKPAPKVSSAELSSVDSVRISEQEYDEIDEELELYTGQFEWQPEGGAEGGGRLTLQYNGNREFSFSLSTSLYECSASVEGTLYADRSQHAFYQSEQCFLHFNFLLGNTVEIIEDVCEQHPKECAFEGDYTRVAE